MAVPADYYRTLGAFVTTFARLEVDLRRAVAADPTPPWAGARRRLVGRPRAVGNATVIQALARSRVHPAPRPLLIDLWRLNDLRVRVVHRAYQPTAQELAWGLATVGAIRRWLTAHCRRLAATARITGVGSRA